MNKIKCPICLNKNILKISEYVNISSVYSNMNLCKCSNCHMVFVDPFPSDKALKDYNDTYFDSAHGGHSLAKETIAVFKGLASLRGVYLNNFLSKKNIKSERILEIGPGPGYFAENWKKNYVNKHYYAIETDESCYSELIKFGVKLIKEKDYNKYIWTMDVVVISHVLEHVSNPKGFLSFANSFLKKGGALFIEIPCNDFQHKKIMEPHLLFFDKKPLTLLLEKINFKEIEINYYGKKISQLKNESFLKMKLKSLVNKIILKLRAYKFLKLEEADLKYIKSKYVRYAVKSYNAHLESDEPTWWLRSLSIKHK